MCFGDVHNNTTLQYKDPSTSLRMTKEKTNTHQSGISVFVPYHHDSLEDKTVVIVVVSVVVEVRVISIRVDDVTVT